MAAVGDQPNRNTNIRNSDDDSNDDDNNGPVTGLVVNFTDAIDEQTRPHKHLPPYSHDLRHSKQRHRHHDHNHPVTAKVDFKEQEKEWVELTTIQKAKWRLSVILRICGLVLALYLFICSLGLLEASFKLVGGRTAGEAFRNSRLLSNPCAGLMIGVMATVLVQSSSTATSIVVALVASEVIPLKAGIPIIMGTNIGTSITNTLVALAQASRRDQFQRAFAGATVHDMFNWLTVMVLLPLEVSTGYLYHLTSAIVSSMDTTSEGSSVEILSAITKPLTNMIVQVNRDAITGFVLENKTATAEAGEGHGDETRVLKLWCDRQTLEVNHTTTHFNPVNIRCSEQTVGSVFYNVCAAADYPLTAGFAISWNTTKLINITTQGTRCMHVFALTDWTDGTVGGLVLALAFLVIVTSLFAIVRTLHSLLHGHLAKILSTSINKDLPGRAAFLTPYLALLVGCAMTLLIQSSSVFTSTLTPLVGMGIVSLDRMYPLTLGSNIGTTVTGIMAAMSTQGPYVRDALQIALCHLFFNLTGTLLFFPVPATRFPLPMSRMLGRKTARYRWFAVFYLLFMFLLFPTTVFALSYAGWQYLAAVGGPALFLFLVTTVINVLQVKRARWLPSWLRDWEFLPLWLHSLEPYDQIVTSCLCCGGGGRGGVTCISGIDSDDELDDDDMGEMTAV